MTVINPNSISGITSITMPSGDGNVLTIHTNDGVERFRIDSSGNVKVGSAATISPDGDVFFTGVTTATTYAGSGANLTNLPAANLSGTLPAISAANLTNVPAANITGTLPAISAANLTNIPAANVTGTLPAITAANLTNIPAANIVGLATAGFERTGGFAGGITEADAWRITSYFQGNDYHIESNWERMDSQTEGKLGTGMSESSGLFTFPSTGYYYVHFMVAGYRGAGSSIYNIVSYIRTTTAGSTSSGAVYNGSGRQSMYSESGNSSFSCSNTTIFKCSDTSNDKIFFGVQTGDASVYVQGSSTENFTYVVFIKLADI